MRALMLEVDERLLAERARLGLDGRDEMWEGVLHLVPPPFSRHQALEAELLLALGPDLRRRGYWISPETGMFAGDDDYRVPDLVVCARSAVSDRGIDGPPELVIEIRSPRDESDAKVPWYLGQGAAAVLVIDRDTLAVDLHTGAGPVPPDGDGLVTLAPLGIRMGPAGPDALVVEVGGERVEIAL